MDDIMPRVAVVILFLLCGGAYHITLNLAGCENCMRRERPSGCKHTGSRANRQQDTTEENSTAEHWSSERWSSERAECEDVNASNCLQQALWGKCSATFMPPGTCDVACGRCESARRRRSLRATLLVSARQSAACAGSSPGADAWVMRAIQNHADYARGHEMHIVWSSALVDAEYDGVEMIAPAVQMQPPLSIHCWSPVLTTILTATPPIGAWNKLSYLHRLLKHELATGHTGRKSTEWLLWCDWDVVFVDLGMELPLEEYEARGARLVVGGDPSGVFERADYLKLNTGIMLLRVHPWSLALVERILHYGRKRARRRHALVLQSHLTNLPVGCLDDQAVLLHLLHDERERWAAHTYLERRFMLQVVCNETRTSLAPDG